jgi:hypothetical protein
MIKYKDLSFWMKIAVIGAWIALITFAIDFSYGFFGALSSY